MNEPGWELLSPSFQQRWSMRNETSHLYNFFNEVWYEDLRYQNLPFHLLCCSPHFRREKVFRRQDFGLIFPLQLFHGLWKSLMSHSVMETLPRDEMQWKKEVGSRDIQDEQRCIRIMTWIWHKRQNLLPSQFFSCSVFHRNLIFAPV